MAVRSESEIGQWRMADTAGNRIGRFILDGYAIADEYRMTGSSGELIVLGMNLRTYDADKQTWNMKWLNALAGTWVDLGPEQLGGVRFDGQSIIAASREPVAAHAYTRATYTNISKSTSHGEGRSLTTGRRGANLWWPRCIGARSSRPVVDYATAA